MKHSPFWWEIEQGLWQASGEVNLPLEADYVIVGAGYTGLSAALTIARQGHSVRVLFHTQRWPIRGDILLFCYRAVYVGLRNALE